MNAQTKIEADPLARLRDPFPDHQISKLPKPTKNQTDEVKADYKKGIRCKICGSWHHPDVVHLDYVGHAALTDRLLDTDPNWFWEPVAFRDGLPAFDQTGGLWIRLTVCGVSRLGYGHAAVKPGMDPGAREKEVIGDALRNAAMRFGAALELWHKGDLHKPEEAPAEAGGDQRDATSRDKPAPVSEPPKGRTVNPMSAHQAKKDGRGERAAKLANEIADLQEVTECLAWKMIHVDEVGTWPKPWQDELWDRWDIQIEGLRELAAKLNPPEADEEAETMFPAAGDNRLARNQVGLAAE